jgi:hypothetical protein
VINLLYSKLLGLTKTKRLEQCKAWLDLITYECPNTEDLWLALFNIVTAQIEAGQPLIDPSANFAGQSPPIMNIQSEQQLKSSVPGRQKPIVILMHGIRDYGASWMVPIREVLGESQADVRLFTESSASPMGT